MANVFYDSGKARIIGGLSPAISLLSDSIYMLLLTNSYTPAAGHSTLADLGTWTGSAPGYEASGTGYTSGGQALASRSIAVDSTNHRGYFTSNQVQWTSATITAAYAVLYKRVGGSMASTDPLVGVYDFGGNKSSSSGNFTIQPDATDGWLYL